MEGPLDSRENRSDGRQLGLALLLLLLAGCWHGSGSDELPWCARPVEIPEGRLFTAGILEPRSGDHKNPVDRLYLPLARETERLGLGLVLLPGGEIVVADVVRGGPAARAGLRPGMRLVGPGPDLAGLLERLAERPGDYTLLEDGTPAKLDLLPGERLLGRRWLFVPLLIDWECDQAGFSWKLPLGLLHISWRQEETGAGRLETEGRLRLFWGLIGR